VADGAATVLRCLRHRLRHCRGAAFPHLNRSFRLLDDLRWGCPVIVYHVMFFAATAVFAWFLSGKKWLAALLSAAAMAAVLLLTPAGAYTVDQWHQVLTHGARR
jgi:hypothetical protein